MNIKKSLYLIITFFLLAIMLYSNIKGITYNCFHATDFSIYQQAIYEIADSWNFNPYLTIRNIKIFNDHFDPILILAAPIAYFSNYNPISLIIFEFLWFLIIFLFLYRKEKNNKNIGFFFIIVLFTKGLLSGIEFPIHPSTWAMFPSFLLGHYILKENRQGIIFSALSLLLFRESFAFGVFALGFFYALKRNWQLSLPLILVSMANIIFVFFLRAYFLGETYSYSSAVFSDLPFKIFLKFDYIAFFKVFYPFFIPLFFIFKKAYKSKQLLTNELGLLVYLSPLLLIFVLTNKIHFHYGAQIVAPLLALMFFSEFRPAWADNRKTLTITTLLFFLSGMSIHTKFFKNSFLSKNSKCEIDHRKLSSIEKLKTIFHRDSGDILSTGGAIPSLLKPGIKFYQAGMFSKVLKKYDYLILEKPGTGNYYPYSNKVIKKTMVDCQYDNVLLNDHWFMLIKSPKDNCIKPLITNWKIRTN